MSDALCNFIDKDPCRRRPASADYSDMHGRSTAVAIVRQPIHGRERTI
jgi:hypothetical protein